MLDGSYVKYPASYPGTINSICNSFFIPMPNKTMTRTCRVDGHWDSNEAACWLGPSDGSGEICIYYYYYYNIFYSGSFCNRYIKFDI